MKIPGFPRRAIPALLLPLLLTGCTSGTASHPAAAGTSPAGTVSASPVDPALNTFYGQRIGWAPCPADTADQGAAPGTLQCGKLRVPLDYTHPAGDTLDLALIREPAADPANRISSLVVNPGGPGESGVSFVRDARKQFEGALHDRFDIVGFDPRGTGDSSPVHCLSDQQRDTLGQQDAPADPQARKAQRDQQGKQYAAACTANSGKELPFVGTRDSARDMDVLRQALGDARLNYLGISYGTYLGSLYAEQFPGRTGRLVLDGAVDPAADRLDSDVQQQIGFEKSLERFVADCVANHPGECPLGTDPAKAGQKAADFLDGLRDHPLPTTDGRKLGSDLGWTGTLFFLYGDETTSWKELRASLAQAIRSGRGDYLLAAADSYNGRDKSGHYNASDDAHTAIGCADGAAPAPSADRVQQLLGQLKSQAPLLNGDTTAEDLAEPGCANWPVQSPETPHTIRAEGSAPILVIGTTGDPATPYAAAQNLAKGFANATLLTREGEGHAAFGSGNTCIDQALDAYLTAGTMPAAGTTCAKS